MVSDSEPLFNRDNYDFEQGMETKEILMAVKLTEERHSFYKGNKTSVNLETSESPSSAGKLLRKTGSLRQALARGSDKARSFRPKSSEAA